MLKRIIPLLALIFASSCTKSPSLRVRTEYIDIKRLASVTVDTPDPTKDTAYFGEKLVASWDLGNTTPPATLIIRIRLRNGEEKRIEKTLDTRSGSEMIKLDAYEFNTSGGIVSYKVELISDGKVLARSLHKLWVEPITHPKI